MPHLKEVTLQMPVPRDRPLDHKYLQTTLITVLTRMPTNIQHLQIHFDIRDLSIAHPLCAMSHLAWGYIHRQIQERLGTMKAVAVRFIHQPFKKGFGEPKSLSWPQEHHEIMAELLPAVYGAPVSLNKPYSPLN